MVDRAPSPRKDYYAYWYQQNKDRISDKRKRAYNEDPDYKEKVLSQSAEHRERQRAESRVKIPRHQVPKKYKTGDGGKVVLFSIGFFAMFISRSVQSINEWERNGILPRTPYIQGTRRFRFYTQAMMEAVKEHVGTKRRLYPVDPEMYDKIASAWKESGVPVGCEDGMKVALKKTKSAKNGA
jgi:hypothetical protein